MTILVGVTVTHDQFYPKIPSEAAKCAQCSDDQNVGSQSPHWEHSVFILQLQYCTLIFVCWLFLVIHLLCCLICVWYIHLCCFQWVLWKMKESVLLCDIGTGVCIPCTVDVPMACFDVQESQVSWNLYATHFEQGTQPFWFLCQRQARNQCDGDGVSGCVCVCLCVCLYVMPWFVDTISPEVRVAWTSKLVWSIIVKYYCECRWPFFFQVNQRSMCAYVLWWVFLHSEVKGHLNRYRPKL